MVKGTTYGGHEGANADLSRPAMPSLAVFVAYNLFTLNADRVDYDVKSREIPLRVPPSDSQCEWGRIKTGISFV